MLSTTLLSFLLLALPTPAAITQAPLIQPPDEKFVRPPPVTLHLRHLHFANSSRALFADVSPEALISPNNNAAHAQTSYTLDTVLQKIHRPSSFAAHAHARMNAMRRGAGLSPTNGSAGELTWEEDEVIGPDVTNRETLLMLAKMTSNAYIYPEEKGWYDFGGKWNVSYPFGWEEGQDGLRGHVFASEDNKTIVISVKGTSAALLGGGGPTAAKDKLNNNLLFSCCCAKVGFSWTPVCGCYAGGWTCDRDCLEASLLTDDSFYPVGTNLYNNVSYMYPEANIWFTGHSLGGALASLLGVTFGTPVVAFETPGEKMAAGRLHLPSPPSTQHVTHVYNTADPVPMGACTGVFSSCALTGFALESRCHLGKTVLYDTVNKLDWSVSIRAHQIEVMIDLLSEDRNWAPELDDGDESAVGLRSEDGDKRYEEVDGTKTGKQGGKEDGGKTEKKHLAVPIAKPEEDCIECYKWEYGDFLDAGSW